jgi:hypothetical protein
MERNCDETLPLPDVHPGSSEDLCARAKVLHVPKVRAACRTQRQSHTHEGFLNERNTFWLLSLRMWPED